MNKLALTRRQLLAGAGAATLSINGLAADSGEAPLKRLYNYADPNDALTAMIKMRGSLVAEDVPNWYFGTIYGILPGQAPIPMVDYEGSEIDYFERQSDGSYRAYAATLSFFRDPVTRKRIDKFNNPITGKVNDVRPNNIQVKAHYIYSIYGEKRSDDPRPLGETPSLHQKMKWSESGDHVWLNLRRPYPPALTMGEDQIISGSLRELHDPSISKVYTIGNPTYMAPWLFWMDMKGHPGHTVWAGPARKLDSVKQYPRELLDYMEKNYPEKLTAKPA
jgi:hypothetical protein